jgi:hypothetical protein
VGSCGGCGLPLLIPITKPCGANFLKHGTHPDSALQIVGVVNNLICKHVWSVNLRSIKITTHLLSYHQWRSFCAVNFIELNLSIMSVWMWNSGLYRGCPLKRCGIVRGCPRWVLPIGTRFSPSLVRGASGLRFGVWSWGFEVWVWWRVWGWVFSD